MALIMKIVAGLIGGLVLGVLGFFHAMIITRPLDLPVWLKYPEVFGFIFPPEILCLFFVWFIGLVIALSAKSAAKAWRSILLTSSILSFLLPVSGAIVAKSNVAFWASIGSPGAVAGAAISGIFTAGFLVIVGFFLGVVLLIVGLLVGRDKQVVYVQAPTP